MVHFFLVTYSALSFDLIPFCCKNSYVFGGNASLTYLQYFMSKIVEYSSWGKFLSELAILRETFI